MYQKLKHSSWENSTGGCCVESQPERSPNPYVSFQDAPCLCDVCAGDTGHKRSRTTCTCSLCCTLLLVIERYGLTYFRNVFYYFKTFPEQVEMLCNSILCVFILLNFNFRCIYSAWGNCLQGGFNKVYSSRYSGCYYLVYS